jgi:hypothetical protein
MAFLTGLKPPSILNNEDEIGGEKFIMNSQKSRGFILILLVSLAAVAVAQAETRRVVVGPQYIKGAFWRLVFGEGYRDLWGTPVELPVIDLKTEAGGLTPLFTVGGKETVGLALKGGDGLSYTFRKLPKLGQRVLPQDWWGTVPAKIVGDQESACHPAAPVIISGLARPVGIRFYRSRLAVMPDDPALGKFRATFGNQPGTLDEYPAAGYEGIVEVISTKDLWTRWLEGPQNRVDSRAFLKARLLDLVTGNWDRNRDQWRWARIPGQPLWQPLPEDMDRCFSRFDGLMMDYLRLIEPSRMVYSGNYPRRLEGLTYNGADVTRWLLSDLDWTVYEEVALELKSQLTDQLIDDAVRRMPLEWYAISGKELSEWIKKRRDGLPEIALRFYLSLADRVDVRGTNRAEIATVRVLAAGALEVTLAPAGADGPGGAPFYERHFSPKDTKEIRIYLLGGNDRLVTSGRATAITLRVLGGPGDDTLDDSAGGQADLRDSEGRNVFLRGPGTKVSRRGWVNPLDLPDGPWIEPRAYGHWTAPVADISWHPDQQLMIGGGFTRTSWAFRKYPWSSLQDFTLVYSTGYQAFRAKYSAQVRLNSSSLIGRVDLLVSGVENLNYYGLGNETANLTRSQRLTHESTYSIFPSLRFQPTPTVEIHVGAEAKALEPGKGVNSLLRLQKPYGSGRFGELALRAGFEWDTRGLPPTPSGESGLMKDEWRTGPSRVSGVSIVGRGFYMLQVWDVSGAFGGVDGSAAAYVGSQRISLAVRAGGRKLWGRYPWFESAAIGGSDTVRGYFANRFRGDASLFGSAELRLWMGPLQSFLPLRWGLFAFADTGRVWLAGEDSRRWHTGVGGGVMVRLRDTPIIVRASVAQGTEGMKFYFSGGYSF